MKYLSMHLTDRCNRTCRFCVVSAPDFQNELNLDQIRSFLGENAGQGYLAVNLHGGEPTLHPHFLEVLDLIGQLGYEECYVQTNGHRLGDPHFVSQLLARRVKRFIVSFHDADEKNHDYLVGMPGAHRKIVAGIRNVIAQSGTVETNTVLTQSNYHRLDRIVAFLYGLGVRRFNLSNIHPAGYAFQSFQEQVPEYASQHPFIGQVIHSYEETDARISLEGFPYCVIPGLENYHRSQLKRQIKMLFRAWVIDDYEAFMNEKCRVKRDECGGCRYHLDCGGVYKEYIHFRGWKEFVPVPPQPGILPKAWESKTREMGP
jgi:sulfatase maturation enzyme AslB (radical SAM superfamily)